jgi:hypothetical protein
VSLVSNGAKFRVEICNNNRKNNGLGAKKYICKSENCEKSVDGAFSGHILLIIDSNSTRREESNDISHAMFYPYITSKKIFKNSKNQLYQTLCAR